MSERDYLAMVRKEPQDREDHGIQGMRWGHRRNDRQIAADTQKRAAKGEAVTQTAKAAAVTGSKPSHAEGHSKSSETSVDRYARLAQEAKSGRGNKMSDEDLKFFNARTEALKKVDALNKTDPGWLSKTSKKVLQSAAEKQMQAIADSIANKYISGPIVDTVGKHVTKEAAKAAAKN